MLCDFAKDLENCGYFKKDEPNKNTVDVETFNELNNKFSKLEENNKLLSSENEKLKNNIESLNNEINKLKESEDD